MIIKKQQGGLVYDPFILNGSTLKIPENTNSYSTNVSYDSNDYEKRFPIEPIDIKPQEYQEQGVPIIQVKEQVTVPEVARLQQSKSDNVIKEPESTNLIVKTNNGKVYKVSEKELFKSDMYNAYLSALTTKGIKNPEEFAKKLVAQDILESRWGQSSLAKYFNFGGIKDFSGNGIQKDTTEYISGKKQSLSQPFRRFSDLNDYVNYKINLVGKKWDVFNYDPKQYYSRIVSGKQKYATDPNYTNKLEKLYKQIWG